MITADRIRQVKQKHKMLAAQIQARATLRRRQRIASQILLDPESCKRKALETLGRRSDQNDHHETWAQALHHQPPSVWIDMLLDTSEASQQRNSCHPFGGCL